MKAFGAFHPVSTAARPSVAVAIPSLRQANARRSQSRDAPRPAGLEVGAAHDPLEREADQVAAQVLSAAAHPGAASVPPRIQRAVAGAGARPQAVPATVGQALAGEGLALEPAVRQDMEQRFAHDFSQVRVHTDATSSQSARDLNAAAYTVGRDIVFGSDRYAPATNEGQRLLAHELTHVVQQGEGVWGAPRLQRQPLGGGLVGADDDAALLWESYRQSLTLDGFDSDKAALQPDHRKRLGEYKQRLQVLLGRYPESFINVIGHTDATDTEAHNKTLGQQRADAVKDELTGGDNALPAQTIHAGSLGESALAVQTQGREARNRRVEVIPTLRRQMKLPPLPTPGPGVSQDGGGTGTGTGEGQGPTRPQPGTGLPGGSTRVPDLSPRGRNWLEDALKKDPIIKSLPDWARGKVIDALKDGDEMVAEKVIDAMPLDGKTKAAVQAVVKSILQMAKGKTFKMPESPPPGREPLPKTEFPKAPGEVIVPGPTWRF